MGRMAEPCGFFVCANCAATWIGESRRKPRRRLTAGSTVGPHLRLDARQDRTGAPRHSFRRVGPIAATTECKSGVLSELNLYGNTSFALSCSMLQKQYGPLARPEANPDFLLSYQCMSGNGFWSESDRHLSLRN